MDNPVSSTITNLSAMLYGQYTTQKNTSTWWLMSHAKLK